MNNESNEYDNNEELDLNLEDELQEEETTEEKPVEKPTESPEARYSRLKRQQEQLLKKHPELGETKTEKKSDNLDYGQKAYLIANGIKGTKEIDLTNRLKLETGKDLDSLLETTYFQSELAKLREQTTTDNANPRGGKGGKNSSVDTVDYWIAKGELPPSSETQLRRDVINARLNKETKGTFYNS